MKWGSDRRRQIAYLPERTLTLLLAAVVALTAIPSGFSRLLDLAGPDMLTSPQRQGAWMLLVLVNGGLILAAALAAAGAKALRPAVILLARMILLLEVWTSFTLAPVTFVEGVVCCGAAWRIRESSASLRPPLTS
jgi:hypothetical protein